MGWDFESFGGTTLQQVWYGYNDFLSWNSMRCFDILPLNWMMLFPMPPQSSLDLKIAIESDTVLTSSGKLTCESNQSLLTHTPTANKTKSMWTKRFWGRLLLLLNNNTIWLIYLRYDIKFFISIL